MRARTVKLPRGARVNVGALLRGRKAADFRRREPRGNLPALDEIARAAGIDPAEHRTKPALWRAILRAVGMGG